MKLPTFAALRLPRRLFGVAVVAALGVVFLAPRPTQAQNTGTVTGQVIDANTQAPMGSAQVYLEGTGLGTLTNQAGRFIILNVPAGSYTIRVDLIGHRAPDQQIDVPAGQTTEVNFSMETEALGLDEIVVTGTAGAARRREVGNTIAQVNLADVPEPPVSVDALLQARVPGMTVMQGSGGSGSGARIRLRGNVSVAMSNQPILYVDGIRVRSDSYAKNVPPVGYPGRSGNDVASPLNDINPADIERIEVIKGAAATTLYGTEAAAGVIQIFTKRGHTGRARWTAQIEQGMNRMQKFGVDPSTRPACQPGTGPAYGNTCVPEPAITASGGTSDYLFINPWLRGHLPSCDDVAAARRAPAGLFQRGWPDPTAADALQPCDNGFFSDLGAWQQRYSLSVAGGGEALQYFVSGAYENDEGMMPMDKEEKVIVRGNFTFAPSSDLQIQWNTSFTSDEISNTAAGNNAHGLTLNSFRRDRNYLADESFDAINPFTNQEITSDIEHLITGVTATYSPLSNQTNRLSVGFDQAQQENRNLRPFDFIRAPLGIIADARGEFTTLTLDYVGTLDFNLTEDLRSSFSWGGQSIATEIQATAAYGEDFAGPGEPVVNSAGTTLGFEYRERVVNAGFFVQNLFDFKNRYFLTAGLRVDGNSAFGEDLGLEAYPKVSASWVMSEESFWDPDWGQIKLRGAWGQSGRAPGAFDAIRTFEPVGWGGEPAFFPRNVGNPELGPERTSEIEVGFEGAFLDDRLAIDFTYYDQNTTDALFRVRQVASDGFFDVNNSSDQLENVGELSNKGVELSVSGVILRGENFGWELGGTLYTNKSKVTLPEEVPDFTAGDGWGWIQNGESVPVMRTDFCLPDPDALGVDPDDVEERHGTTRADGSVVDCTIGPNAPTHIIGGFTTVQLPYGITLSARGEYQGGNYIYDGAAWNAIRRSVIWPGCYDVYSTIADEGLNALTAKEKAQCLVEFNRADYRVYDRDFFKLREITASVPIPQSWLPWGEDATFTISGRNVWRWVNDDFPVFEPEMTNNNDNNPLSRDGVSSGAFLESSLLEHIPPPQTWTAAIRVSF
jgi:TonB-dependent SusC/RagA subfamily outer membrane receptor